MKRRRATTGESQVHLAEWTDVSVSTIRPALGFTLISRTQGLAVLKLIDWSYQRLNVDESNSISTISIFTAPSESQQQAQERGTETATTHTTRWIGALSGDRTVLK